MLRHWRDEGAIVQATMNALPIVTRELITRARQPQTHWLRVAFAAVAVLLAMQFLLFWTGRDIGELGSLLFHTLAWITFLLASAGFMLTADSLSAERREGTLGLLVLTRVGVPDVLAGKLASSGLNAVLGLLAVTPVLALPVLVGGVTWQQVARVALSLPGLLFFSLCAGLWASSSTLRMGRAFLRAAACVVLVVKVPLILSATLAGMPPWNDWVRSLSPGGAFLWGSGVVPVTAQAAYWSSAAVGFLLGGVLLVVSSRNLRKSWCQHPEDVAGMEPGVAGARPSVGDHPPMQWLLSRSTFQTRLLWLGVALLLVPKVASASLPGLIGAVTGAITAFHFICTAAAAGAFSVAGALFFIESRRNGALELLRTTPVGHRTVLTAQWAWLRGRLLGPVVLLVLAGLAAQALGWARFPGAFIFRMPMDVSMLVATVFDVVALCVLGLWFGYRARSAWSALLWPVGLVAGLNLVLTLILWGLISRLFNALAYGGVSAGLIMSVLTVLPALALIAKQVWLIRWAKRRLQSALGGAEVKPVDVKASVSRAVEAVRRARHWTQGGDS